MYGCYTQPVHLFCLALFTIQIVSKQLYWKLYCYVYYAIVIYCEYTVVTAIGVAGTVLLSCFMHSFVSYLFYIYIIFNRVKYILVLYIFVSLILSLK